MNAPDADAPRELQFRLQVDEAHCDRAAQGLRLMAQFQFRSQVARNQRVAWFRRFQQMARKAAPALAAIVFLAALFATWVGSTDASARPLFFVLAAILLAEAVALWLLPSRADRIGAATREWFARYFGNRAATMLRKTRRAVPFEAVYDLRGELLTYSRIEKGQWAQRWHRQLGKFRARGVALQTPGLLAIFPKPGAVVPAMIMLTDDEGGMAAAIRALGWTVTDLDEPGVASAL
jgi:hypothetical protein